MVMKNEACYFNQHHQQQAVAILRGRRNFHEVLSCHQLLFSAFAIFALIVTQTFLMSFAAHVVDCLIFLLCYNNHHSKIVENWMQSTLVHQKVIFLSSSQITISISRRNFHGFFFVSSLFSTPSWHLQSCSTITQF